MSKNFFEMYLFAVNIIINGKKYPYIQPFSHGKGNEHDPDLPNQILKKVFPSKPYVSNDLASFLQEPQNIPCFGRMLNDNVFAGFKNREDMGNVSQLIGTQEPVDIHAIEYSEVKNDDNTVSIDNMTAEEIEHYYNKMSQHETVETANQSLQELSEASHIKHWAEFHLAMKHEEQPCLVLDGVALIKKAIDLTDVQDTEITDNYDLAIENNKQIEFHSKYSVVANIIEELELT